MHVRKLLADIKREWPDLFADRAKDAPPTPDWASQPTFIIRSFGKDAVNRDTDEAEIETDEVALDPETLDNYDPGDLDGEVKVSGHDALAYYKPFHWHYRNRWGIYLRERGIVYLLKRLDARKGANLPARMRSVCRFLAAHEFMHFEIEVAATFLELMTLQRIYVPGQKEKWSRYHEEMLSNAYAFRRRSGLTKKSVEAFMDSQPEGYRDFRKALKPEDYAEAIRKIYYYFLRESGDQMGGFLCSLALAGTAELVPYEMLFDLDFLGHLSVEVPVFLVREPTKGKILELVRNGAKAVVYPGDHPPPHMHVWIPPSGRMRKYRLPDLFPLDGNPPLSNKERWRVIDIINDASFQAKAIVTYPELAAVAWPTS